MGVPRNRVLEIQRVDELNALTNLVQNDALLRTLSLHVHQQLLKQLASSTDLLKKGSTKGINAIVSRLAEDAVKTGTMNAELAITRAVETLVKENFVKGRTQNPQMMLIEATERAMKDSIYIVFHDSDFTWQLKQVQYANLYLGQQFKEMIPSLVYQTLVETFEKSWANLSEDAFPWMYKQLILRVLQTKLQVKVIGTAVTDWMFAINFNELFGDINDLEEGYHYGALLAAGGNTKAYGPYQRSTIPYKDQDLKNPVRVRYNFWYTIWRGGKFYSSYGARQRPAHARKFKAGYERLNAATQQIGQQLTEQFEKGKVLKRGPNKGKVRFDTREDMIKFQNLSKRYRKVRDIKTRMGENLNTPPLEIANPKELKANTLAARASYWARKNIAPVWILLEYGQVRYPPTIPPKGVFEKFRISLDLKLKTMITEAYNTEFAKLRYTSKGTVVLADDRPVSMPLPLGISQEQATAMNLGLTAMPGDKLYLMLPKAINIVDKATKDAEMMRRVSFYYYSSWSRAGGQLNSGKEKWWADAIMELRRRRERMQLLNRRLETGRKNRDIKASYPMVVGWKRVPGKVIYDPYDSRSGTRIAGWTRQRDVIYERKWGVMPEPVRRQLRSTGQTHVRSSASFIAPPPPTPQQVFKSMKFILGLNSRIKRRKKTGIRGFRRTMYQNWNVIRRMKFKYYD